MFRCRTLETVDLVDHAAEIVDQDNVDYQCRKLDAAVLKVHESLLTPLGAIPAEPNPKAIYLWCIVTTPHVVKESRVSGVAFLVQASSDKQEDLWELGRVVI